jgi:hypothetical protein
VWFRHAGLFIYGFDLATRRSIGGGVAKILFIAQPASFVQAIRSAYRPFGTDGVAYPAP